MNRFPAAQRAFRDAYGSANSTFYRDLYASKLGVDVSFPRNEKEWRTIPLMSKADVLKVPFEKRLFVPLRETDAIRTSSGTTASGILCTPRTIPMPLPPEDPPLILSLRFASFNPHFVLAGLVRFEDVPDAVIVDQSDLEASARFSAQLGIDFVYGSPSQLISFAPHLGAHMDIGLIRHIRLGSELLSAAQREVLARAYPKARITFSYSSIDAQGAIALSPEEEIPGHPAALQVVAEYYIELIKEDGSLCELPGEEGEVVITTIAKAAFPLIRYKMGDIARIVSKDESRLVIELVGRAEGSRVRISGGEIILSELQRVVEKLALSGVVDFEAEVSDEKGGDSLRQRLSVTFITDIQANVTLPLEMIATTIASQLRVNQSRTYVEGVEAGLYAPLTCKTLPMVEILSRKIRRLHDTRVTG